jgi:hypothetical protein
VTVGAIAALAFVTACVSHEAIGHGGTCLAVGGQITRLTSVLFGCRNGGAITDAGGLMMNLAVGATLWTFLRTRRVTSLHWRLFLVLSMAYNLFWAAGQMMLNAATNGGDAVFALRGWALAPLSLWRGGLAVAGLALYLLALRGVAARLPRGLPLLVPYLAAGVLACAATLCFAGGVTPSIFREGIEEGFGTGIGLLLAGRFARNAENTIAPRSAPEADDVPRSVGWIATSVVVTLAFLLTLGRGVAA